MTLYSAFVVIAAVETVLVCVNGYALFATRRLSCLESYEQWADLFFDSAETLVSDSRTPAPILVVIGELNKMITMQEAAVAINKIYRRRLLEGAKSQAHEPDPDFEAFLQVTRT